MYNFLLSLWVVSCVVWAGPAWGLQVRLRWTDTSPNEEGFRIERRLQNNGTYAQIAQITANSSTYADATVALNTTYCYRVSAFAKSLVSPYSDEQCIATTVTTTPQPSGGGGTGSPPPPPPNGGGGSVGGGGGGTLSSAERLTVYRPGTGAWYVDRNGNGSWDACQTDACIPSFGLPGSLPVIGQWGGGQTPRLGLFTPQTGAWVLDLNGNGQIDACSIDRCGGFGGPGDLPVAVQPKAGGPSLIGVFRPREARWYLDANGNGYWDGCAVDICTGYGAVGDRPVTGDWTGTGVVTIGVFRPSTGMWYLDANANNIWDGCAIDRCLGPFGVSSDQPVVGKWTGTGSTKLGVFDPATSLWELDANGNGHWDGCAVDRCLGPFGDAADVPLSAPWQ